MNNILFGHFINTPLVFLHSPSPAMTVLENCEDFIMVAADSASPSSGFQMFDVNSAISRTFSSPPAMPEKHTFKKRKPNNPHNSKFAAENDNKDKRIKVGADHGESKITNTNNTDQSLEKPDYIHVRARRGQATDSHSLAERVRREKISERMKYLQDLVPGCNKITGKAGMLDEIINYVRSLQRQVEFLSMKLATVNSSLDFNMDDVFDTELFPTLHHHHIVPYGELDTAINPSDMGLRRTLSAPVSVSMPQTFLHSSSFTQILPSSTLEDDFQNLYNLDFDQPSPTSFPSHLSTFHRSD